MTRISIYEKLVSNSGMWFYHNQRMDLAGPIDPDICGRLEPVAVLNGVDLGVNGTAVMLDVAKNCACRNVLNDCVACEISEAVSEFQHARHIMARKVELEMLAAA